MAKKTVSAKIGQIVYEQAKLEAKRRGKTFSKLVEIALIHELENKNNNNGLIAELKELNGIITNKINELEEESDNNLKSDLENNNKILLNELITVYDKRFKLSAGMIMHYANKMGLSYQELVEILKDHLGDNFNIEN